MTTFLRIFLLLLILGSCVTASAGHPGAPYFLRVDYSEKLFGMLDPDLTHF